MGERRYSIHWGVFLHSVLPGLGLGEQSSLESLSLNPQLSRRDINSILTMTCCEVGCRKSDLSHLCWGPAASLPLYQSDSFPFVPLKKKKQSWIEILMFKKKNDTIWWLYHALVSTGALYIFFCFVIAFDILGTFVDDNMNHLGIFFLSQVYKLHEK